MHRSVATQQTSKYQNEVFWAVTWCSDLVGYQSFGRPYCIHLQGEDGGSKVLRNFGVQWRYYTASETRKPRLGCTFYLAVKQNGRCPL